MDEYKTILKKVGTVLIVVGLLDIGVMIYCIANQISYSSSFNIFAVIAGIILRRGGLTAARVVAWFAAFMLSGFAVFVVIYPFIGSLKLLVTQFSINPFGMILSTIVMAAIIYLMFWIYNQLRRNEVITAREEAGLSTSKPIIAFTIGTGIPIIVGIMINSAYHSEGGKKIIAKATEHFGAEYTYQINSIHWSGNSVSAQLSAYNDSEVIPVFVACKEASNENSCSLNRGHN